MKEFWEDYGWCGVAVAMTTGFFAFLIIVGCCTNTNPGNGEKIGQIVKVENTGVFRRTWEAQLIRGGMNNGTGSFGVMPFDFTIEDSTLLAKVQKAMQNQTEIKICYRTEFIYWPLRSGSKGSFLITITPLSGKAELQ